MKKEKVSCILSGKIKCEGHRQRLKIAKELAELSDDIHFYGRGLEKRIPGARFYGALKEKWNGLERYFYSFVFENTRLVNYFTEKICDAFLAQTMPIYWGCPNISDFFPEGSYLSLDQSNLTESLERIKEPLTSKQLEAILEAKYLVLHKYNLWPTLQRIVNGDLK